MRGRRGETPSARWPRSGRTATVTTVELKISKQSRIGHTLVSICGELDLYTAPLLRSGLADAVVPRTRTVVDMSGVEFCDSTGLSVLLSALKQARRNGGELELAALQSPVRRILQITGLDEVFTIHATVDAPAAAATGAAK
ncbi:anti-sigma B factor antagonist [Thermobifida halotolerans]